MKSIRWADARAIIADELTTTGATVATVMRASNLSNNQAYYVLGKGESGPKFDVLCLFLEGMGRDIFWLIDQLEGVNSGRKDKGNANSGRKRSANRSGARARSASK